MNFLVFKRHYAPIVTLSGAPGLLRMIEPYTPFFLKKFPLIFVYHQRRSSWEKHVLQRPDAPHFGGVTMVARGVTITINGARADRGQKHPGDLTKQAHRIV